MSRSASLRSLCVLLTLALAACGGDSDSDAPATTAAPTTQAPAPAQPVTDPAAGVEQAAAAPVVDMAAFAGDNPPSAEFVETVQAVGGLVIDIIERGTGSVPRAGQTVMVHYTGRLQDGTKFDSSYDHPGGNPLAVPAGLGKVIQGWDTALTTLPVGSKARLTIPADLAYGDRGIAAAGIPPGATLIFHIELVDVK